MEIQRRFVAVAVSYLLALLCGIPALAQAIDASKTPPADKALQKAIHDYILAHPEVLIQSLRIEGNVNKFAKRSKTRILSRL